MTKIAIIGIGGFAREVYFYLKELQAAIPTEYQSKIYFVGMEHENPLPQFNYIHENDFNAEEYLVLIAVGSPGLRELICKDLGNVDYGCISPNINESIKYGIDFICMQGVILTCNIVIGNHCQFNLNTTVGHDCMIGNFVTTAPGVHISGNVTIGNNVYIGSGATIKQGVKICDNVVIGMGAVVLNDITEAGTYVGVPAKKK